MSDITKLYNPANAGSLTKEEIEGLQKLTSAEIKELAIAYPNMTMQRSYLLIVDSRKAADKQLPALSTFENLWNLREKNGMRYYVPFAFKGAYKSKTNVPVRAKKTEVLDLSDVELMDLPGFKKNGLVEAEIKQKGFAAIVQEMIAEPIEQVKVRKIKKVPVKTKSN